MCSNPSIEVSDGRFCGDNSNMPLQSRRRQVALYRSVIKVLTFFSFWPPLFRSLFLFFRSSFSRLTLSVSRSLTFCHAAPLTYIYIFFCFPSLSSFRLGGRRATSKLEGDGSNGRQHRGEVLQLQHTSNVSPAATHHPSPLPPPLHIWFVQ